MKQKIEQLNQSYKKALAIVIQEEFPEEGILIESVLLDPSMQHGRVWLICKEEQLIRVQKKGGELQGLVQSHLRTRYTPRLEFILSDSYLQDVDKLFEKIEKDTR